MSLRNALNGNPKAVAAVVVVLALGAIYLGYRQFRSPSTSGAGATYFTDDDGKTWFGGDKGAISPIDHNGKPAYRAYVYTCADGKEFVGYMDRYPEDLKALFIRAKANPDSITMEERGKLMNMTFMRQIKKPGEANWGPPPGRGVIITCPDGKPALLVRE